MPDGPPLYHLHLSDLHQSQERLLVKKGGEIVDQRGPEVRIFQQRPELMASFLNLTTLS